MVLHYAPYFSLIEWYRDDFSGIICLFFCYPRAVSPGESIRSTHRDASSGTYRCPPISVGDWDDFCPHPRIFHLFQNWQKLSLSRWTHRFCAYYRFSHRRGSPLCDRYCMTWRPYDAAIWATIWRIPYRNVSTASTTRWHTPPTHFGDLRDFFFMKNAGWEIMECSSHLPGW